ncbi:PspC domain-containing protein [Pacificimonas flava]|uniref:Phage shock protein C n=1 Tax=Pacificimonas flava TaxID=1234595 RepID=M2U4J2_9SPHN|nr:PspC domain-containing protein [Pacificimonas flava]EMD82952.1 Phage shock protein C [Pacificimonas flava]MBB5280112.1 phage shock protein C [Pacificimonas flava]
MRTHDQLDKPYSPSRFYLNKHEGKFMGVCAGLADYTGIEALWWRVGLFVSLWMTGGMTLFLYLLVGFFADKRPAYLPSPAPEERQFQMKARRAPQGTIRDVHARFRALDRRLSSIEKHHTTSNSSLAREIDALK